MSDGKVKLVAVGDLMLGEDPFVLGHGVASMTRKKGCDFFFEKTKEYLRDGDIVCGNLEGIISARKQNENGIASKVFRGEPECAGAIKRAGFNCIFLSNNHMAQHGVDALKRTCDLLNENNIKWVGYNPSDAARSVPVIFDKGGVRIGILAYCETQQYNLETKILPIICIERIKNDIALLKEQCDVVVISLHWGDEFIDYPSLEQMDIAHEIIDTGANLILGYHPHTLQGIEEYNNGLIIYSLSSFISNLWRKEKEMRESVIFTCELTKDGVNNFEFIPVEINKNFQPKSCAEQDKIDFNKRLKFLSDKIQANKCLDQDVFKLKYDSDVKYLAKMDRVDNFKYYIRNFFRYDKKLLLEHFLLILKRRLYKKNI